MACLTEKEIVAKAVMAIQLMGEVVAKYIHLLSVLRCKEAKVRSGDSCYGNWKQCTMAETRW